MSGALEGSRVGRYRLEAHLGTGGMGSVYRAHDTVLERDVAIKLVSHGAAAGAEAQARLLREGQALARLDHPHVVRIFDVGRSEHGLFVAMELVHGRTLARWVAEERPTWRAIVRTYVQAGRGLMAGHRLDIVHRDFKPANVMRDREGRARVLDFGLARLLDGAPETPSEDPEPDPAMDLLSTCLTRDGEIIGTPIYMAPEQHHARETTQASDQFSFCAALFEALAGEQPFRRSALVDVVHAKDKGPPDVPTSTDVPRAVWSALRRGLQPEPPERWPSMAALIDALEASLGGGRARYAAVVALLGAGVVAAALLPAADPGPRCRDVRVLDPIWNDARDDDLRRGFASAAPTFGEQAWTSAAERVQAWSEDWTAAHQRACEDAADPGTDDEDETAQELDARMACLRGQADSLDATLEALEGPERTTVTRASFTIASLPAPKDCLDPSLRAPPRANTAEAEPIHAFLRRARASYHAGRPDRSRDAAEQAVALARDSEEPALIAEALLQRGIGNRVAGKQDEAVADYQEAYFLASEHDDAATAAMAAARLVAAHAGRDSEELERWAGHARAAIDRAPRVGWLEGDLLGAEANHARKQDDLPKALGKYREALGKLRGLPSDGQSEASLRAAVANVLTELGRYEEAVPAAREAVARAQTLGEHHPSNLSAQSALGIALWYRGDAGDAVEVFTRGAAIGEAIYGIDHPRVQVVLDNRAGALIDAGQPELALEYFAETIPKLAPDEHASRLARVLGEQSRALRRLGRVREEIESCRRAVEIRRATLPERHPKLALSLTNLGSAERRVGDTDASIEHLREAVDIFVESVGESNTRTITARSLLARSLAAKGQSEEALDQIDRVTAAIAVAELDPVDRAGVELAVVDVWLVAGREDDARQRAAELRTTLDALGKPAAHLLRELDELEK